MKKFGLAKNIKEIKITLHKSLFLCVFGKYFNHNEVKNNYMRYKKNNIEPNCQQICSSIS